MVPIRTRARWGRLAAAIYLALALVAGAIALERLSVSSEMPGLAAWELLVLALPWTLALQTPIGREVGGVGLAAVIVGGVALNAWLLNVIVSALYRWWRAA